MATLSDDSCRMLPEAHAWEVVRAPEVMNVPEVDAVQIEIAVIVSDVPPFVHCGLEVVIVIVPDDEVPNVTETRVEEPAEMLVVPAVPGAAVCSWTKTLPEVV
jgi:hypothetical protein